MVMNVRSQGQETKMITHILRTATPNSHSKHADLRPDTSVVKRSDLFAAWAFIVLMLVLTAVDLFLLWCKANPN
jgi:hypothetical protein